MKIKEEFQYFEVNGDSILVPVGTEMERFKHVVVLTKAAGYLVQKMTKEDLCPEELVGYLMEKYHIDATKARKDLQSFLDRLTELKIIA